MDMELIYQGAEAKVYTMSYLSRPAVLKERLAKTYRMKQLDAKINKMRLLSEVRCMVKCRKQGVPTACIYFVDVERYRVCMERISGVNFKDYLRSEELDLTRPEHLEQAVKIARMVGTCVAKMHDAGVVHGDLTTSNIMVRDTEGREPVLIDFGLAQMQAGVEDKAVDLYVLERAFVSTHPGTEKLVDAILESYRFTGFSSSVNTKTLMRLDQVRSRGRKRDMIG
jgi:TP53 regulating kinase-like protein